MNSLSAQCCQSAEILNKELLALQRIPGQGRLKAVANLFTRKIKAGEIQGLKRRLEENQRTLDTKVLIDVRQMIVALTEQNDDRYTSVYQELTSLAAKLDSCHISAGDHLKTIISNVIESNKHEHQATRMHFGDTVQALTTSQAQKQEQTIKYERFIDSLRFDDIHVRGNEVSKSHAETFGWVFDDHVEYPWDNLKAWLESGQSIYWINGKAGSGKSTFMKFLVNDERTLTTLDIWSGGQACMILTFYFWLSGTKFQRSLKGFLCSLIYQIVSTNEMVLAGILQTHTRMINKRCLGDWAIDELSKMLEFAIESVNRTDNICVFVDGIDEFDQDEDLQQFLDLIKKLAGFPRTKLCLSSRPETHLERCLSQYSKLRLQDLTAKDMEICIRDRLDRVYEMYPSIRIEAADIERFFRLMTWKADGVFLWVYFALNSLLKGMRNEDDFEVLLTRLEELPTGMERLYQQMWLRLNGDEERYRREASLYFSYDKFYPRSLFEMTIALNEDIQTKYFHEMQPQDPTQLAQKCEILRKRILTTCAGLLEITETVRDSEYDDSPSSTSRLDSIESSAQTSESLAESSSNDESQLVDREESISLVHGSPVLHSTSSSESFGTQASAHDSLQPYHDIEIKFLHRTARDFLLDTEAGHAIAGETSQTRDDRFSRVTRARIATLLEGLEAFRGKNVKSIIEDIGNFDTKDEIELLETLRHVCETLHVPGSRTRDITRSRFWNTGGYGYTDYVGSAPYRGCTKYVQWYIDHATTHLSPYYLGYLFRLAITAFQRNRKGKNLQLAFRLADEGADLETKHISSNTIGSIATPFRYFLKMVLDRDDWASIIETATQVAQFIERLYSTALKPEDKFVLSRDLPEGLEDSFGISGLEVEFEGNFLYRLVFDHLRRSGVVLKNMKSVPIRSSTPVNVVLFWRDLRDSVKNHCLRITPKDAAYLGQAYEKVLLVEDNTDAPGQSLETFASRLEEVISRCEEMDVSQLRRWELEMGFGIDLPENTLVLDPSEDVDESNWKERGYFRTVTDNPRHGSVFTVMDPDRELTT